MALIELKIGDSVAALKCLNLIPVLALQKNFFTLINQFYLIKIILIIFSSTVSLFSQEISALETLICAYESGDDETFENCLKSSVWKSLNNEVFSL